MHNVAISVILYGEGGEVLADNLLTYKEVAERLSVSIWTVRSWVRKGYLKSLKIGEKTVRVSEADLSEFIKRKEE